MGKTEMKKAIMEIIMYTIDKQNFGMMSNARLNFSTQMKLRQENIKVDLDHSKVLQNGEMIYKLERNFASRKVNGMYKELKPKLIDVFA